MTLKPETKQRLSKAAPWVCLAVLLCTYLGWLLKNHEPALTHPDANGYWAQASLLATTGRTWFVPEADPQYVGMHWLVTDSGRYYSRYPPGLPVLIAAVYNGRAAGPLFQPGLLQDHCARASTGAASGLRAEPQGIRNARDGTFPPARRRGWAGQHGARWRAAPAGHGTTVATRRTTDGRLHGTTGLPHEREGARHRRMDVPSPTGP